MGMSTRVYGIASIKDAEFNAYVEIAKKCEEIGADCPQKVEEYLEELGIDIYDVIADGEYKVYLPVDSNKEISEDCSDIIEVDLSKVPSNITKIRFENSY